MKIGLSLSRCVRDIVEGRVNINDILVIIARTKFDPTDDRDWICIWEGYSQGSLWNSPEWAELYEEPTKKIVLDLWHRGLIHQPRNFGAEVIRRSEYWLEAVLPSDELQKSPAALAAWNDFLIIAGLTNTTLDTSIS
jgi:hypothetical protein